MLLHKNASGTCAVIGHEEGGVDFTFCIDRCLDMPGCSGTTFNWILQRCDFHNCSDYQYWANATGTDHVQFMEKRCIVNTPKPFRQVCTNCKEASYCQIKSDISTSMNLPTWQDCQQQLDI
ncbi:hypothetical protein MAR_034216, partial [Mya arenaria]